LSLQHSADPLLVFRRPTSKGREGKGKERRWEGKRVGRGRGKCREGKVEMKWNAGFTSIEEKGGDWWEGRDILYQCHLLLDSITNVVVLLLLVCNVFFMLCKFVVCCFCI